MAPAASFTDGLIYEIDHVLCSVPPERGGALIGAAGIAHHLVEDVSGGYSSSWWDISSELTNSVQSVERAGRGRFCGTVHTHPAGVPDPSTQDFISTQRTLEANPAISSLLVCIVTEGSARDGDLVVGLRHRMSVHVVTRSIKDSVRIERAHAVVLPIVSDLAACGSDGTAVGAHLQFSARSVLAYPLSDALGSEPVVVGFTNEYPDSAPVFAKFVSGEFIKLASPIWSGDFPSNVQLSRAANLLELRPRKDQFERVSALVGELSTKSVLIVGLGS